MHHSPPDEESLMPLPPLLARPIFNLLYRLMRGGSPIPPIRRDLQPAPPEQQAAFDLLLDQAFTQGPGSPLDYRLPYPRLDFLNYACDWRGLPPTAPPTRTWKPCSRCA